MIKSSNKKYQAIDKKLDKLKKQILELLLSVDMRALTEKEKDLLVDLIEMEEIK